MRDNHIYYITHVKFSCGDDIKFRHILFPKQKYQHPEFNNHVYSFWQSRVGIFH